MRTIFLIPFTLYGRQNKAANIVLQWQIQTSGTHGDRSIYNTDFAAHAGSTGRNTADLR